MSDYYNTIRDIEDGRGVTQTEAHMILDGLIEQAEARGAAEVRAQVKALADTLAVTKPHALTDKELRITAKYAVPEVINKHVTVHVLAKVADDLRALAADGGQAKEGDHG